MTLKNLLKIGQLKEHPVSAAEIERLLTAAERARHSLRDERPRIPEQPHPAAPFAGAVGVPRVLYRARRALRVRHHDRDAAVCAGD